MRIIDLVDGVDLVDGPSATCVSYILFDAEDSNVFYLERNNVPGVCVESKLNKSLSWTPVKFSRHQIKAVEDSSDDDDDVCLDDCVY